MSGESGIDVLGGGTKVSEEPRQVSCNSESRCSDSEYGEAGCNCVSGSLDCVELNRTGGSLTCGSHGD
jgi:hypothetical protein